MATFSDKCMILRGALTGITTATPTSMSFAGAGSLVSSWVAPVAGMLYSISGTQQAALSASTLSIGVAINGAASGFASPALAFTGNPQNFYVVSGPTLILFAPGDVITLVATSSAGISLGYSAGASVIAALHGALT